MKRSFLGRGFVGAAAFLLWAVVGAGWVYADAGPADEKQSEAVESSAPGAESAEAVTPASTSSETSQADSNSAAPLNQFPRTESAAPASSGIDFPKVKNDDDAVMAKKFSWWPTDARPAPVKDSDQSGYWWWPQTPGSQSPWGNQGYVYVRKVIFDYKTAEGPSKPSLVIKKILKNIKVYFDYDKSDLRDDAQQILSEAVGTLDRNRQADLLITGNADVRGSEQYNYKLAARRADSVKQFFTDHGVTDDRIRVLSRGKLDAMAPANDLVGLQKDRNAQFMIAEIEEVMIPADQAALYQDKVIEEKKDVESSVKVDTKDYVIQSGDTLWKIAKKEYGDGRQWKRIYEFNKDVIQDANRPKKGTRIRIPIE